MKKIVCSLMLFASAGAFAMEDNNQAFTLQVDEVGSHDDLEQRVDSFGSDAPENLSKAYQSVVLSMDTVNETFGLCPNGIAIRVHDDMSLTPLVGNFKNICENFQERRNLSQMAARIIDPTTAIFLISLSLDLVRRAFDNYDSLEAMNAHYGPGGSDHAGVPSGLQDEIQRAYERAEDRSTVRGLVGTIVGLEVLKTGMELMNSHNRHLSMQPILDRVWAAAEFLEELKELDPTIKTFSTRLRARPISQMGGFRAVGPQGCVIGATIVGATACFASSNPTFGLTALAAGLVAHRMVKNYHDGIAIQAEKIVHELEGGILKYTKEAWEHVSQNLAITISSRIRQKAENLDLSGV